MGLAADRNKITHPSEDYQQFQAHKVILSSTSKFFNKMLENIKHPHPLKYMRGLSSADMGALIDFIYDGEAKVEQNNSDTFFKLTTELELFGIKKQC